MSWIPTSLQPAYHVQDNKSYCGSACVMMMIDSSTNSTATLCGLDQSTIFYHAHDCDYDIKWSMTPKGMAAVLGEIDRYSLTPYTYIATKYPLEGEQLIINSLAQGVMPAVAVTLDGETKPHWVTISHVATTPDPSPNGNYQITHITIMSPEKHSISNNPDKCSLGTHYREDECQSHQEGSILPLEYSRWQNHYFKSCTYTDSNQYCVVGTANQMTLPPPQETHFLDNFVDTPWAAFTQNDTLSQMMIESQDKINFLNQTEYSFLDKSVFAESIPVQRIDKTGLHYPYSIIAFRDERGYTALATVNIVAQHLSEIAPMIRPVKNWRLSDKQIEVLVQAKFRNLQISTGLHIEQGLFWRPCQQSKSPFLPFHRAHYGIHTFYIRVDGEVFDELTDPTKSG